MITDLNINNAILGSGFFTFTNTKKITITKIQAKDVSNPTNTL